MARGMSQQRVREMAKTYFPQFLEQREQAEKLDTWARGEQKSTIYVPDQGQGLDREYSELLAKSPNAWGGLLITSVVQNAELVGMRMPGKEENLAGWRSWQRNRMDARADDVHEMAIRDSETFVLAS